MDKQLSKEEILETKPSFFYLEIYVYHEDGVMEAMGEYSKQECIAFAEFIKDNHYTRNLNSEDTRWYKYFSVREDFPSGVSMLSGVSEYFTTEQLYSLYQSK